MVYGGKTHVFPPLFCFHLFLFHQPIQCLDFVNWGQLLHEEMWAWENVGFGRLLSVLDGTHAQWRTFVSLTPVFILPMVGCPHGWSVLPHREVGSVLYSSRRDQQVVLSRPCLLTQPGEELCIGGHLHFPTEWKSGMFFLCFGLTDYVLGLLSSPCFVGCGVQLRFGATIHP